MTNRIVLSRLSLLLNQANKIAELTGVWKGNFNQSANNFSYQYLSYFRLNNLSILQQKTQEEGQEAFLQSRNKTSLEQNTESSEELCKETVSAKLSQTYFATKDEKKGNHQDKPNTHEKGSKKGNQKASRELRDDEHHSDDEAIETPKSHGKSFKQERGKSKGPTEEAVTEKKKKGADKKWAGHDDVHESDEETSHRDDKHVLNQGLGAIHDDEHIEDAVKIPKGDAIPPRAADVRKRGPSEEDIIKKKATRKVAPHGDEHLSDDEDIVKTQKRKAARTHGDEHLSDEEAEGSFKPEGRPQKPERKGPSEEELAEKKKTAAAKKKKPTPHGDEHVSDDEGMGVIAPEKKLKRVHGDEHLSDEEAEGKFKPQGRGDFVEPGMITRVPAEDPLKAVKKTQKKKVVVPNDDEHISDEEIEVHESTNEKKGKEADEHLSDDEGTKPEIIKETAPNLRKRAISEEELLQKKSGIKPAEKKLAQPHADVHISDDESDHTGKSNSGSKH